jgi:hypothetical protein
MNGEKGEFEWKDTDDVERYDTLVRLIMFMGKLKIFNRVGYGSTRQRGMITRRWILFSKE